MTTTDGSFTEGQGRRLNGWKEISSHFDRSTRTVQRWEREFALPVRRLGIGKGEVVYAWTGELALWQRETEAVGAKFLKATESDAEHGRSGGALSARRSLLRRMTGRAVSVGAAAVLTIGAAAVWLWPAADGAREPALTTETAQAPPPLPYRIDGNTLTALGPSGQPIWSHAFPFRLEPDQFSSPDAIDRISNIDLDGDGRHELLFISRPADSQRTAWGLHCFSDRGALLWSVGPVTGHGFGGRMYTPLKADRFFIEQAPTGVVIWGVFVHSPWFPSVLLRIDARGQITGEFWSAGHITLVTRVEWDGRRLVLVGARNNQTGGASVALLDADALSATAPSDLDEFLCSTCPSERPLAFVQLPKPGLLAHLRGSSPVARIEADDPSAVLVWVDHGHDPSYMNLTAIYTLDRSLRPIRVEPPDRYLIDLTRVFADAGRPVPAGYVPEDDYPPARWWDGQRFVEIPIPR